MTYCPLCNQLNVRCVYRDPWIAMWHCARCGSLHIREVEQQ